MKLPRVSIPIYHLLGQLSHRIRHHFGPRYPCLEPFNLNSFETIFDFKMRNFLTSDWPPMSQVTSHISKIMFGNRLLSEASVTNRSPTCKNLLLEALTDPEVIIFLQKEFELKPKKRLIEVVL